MELLQLRYFAMAAKLENFTQAAKMLQIPQPALSITIKRLEKELGYQLFDRLGNRIILNDAGRRYLKKIESALQMIDDANREIMDINQTLSGEINLLILTNRRIITEFIIGFYKDNKNITFHIDHEYSGKQQYDLYVMDENETAPEPLRQELLVEEELLLAVSEHHPLSKRLEVNVRDLRNERIITMPAGRSLNRIITQACLQEGFFPTINITCDDPVYIRKYVAEGLGVALIPSFSWKGLFDERIKLVKFIPSICRRTVIAWNDGRYQSKAVIAFRNYVLNRIKEETY